MVVGESGTELWPSVWRAEGENTGFTVTNGCRDLGSGQGGSCLTPVLSVPLYPQDEYDDIVVHSGRSQNQLPPSPASKPLPDDPNPA